MNSAAWIVSILMIVVTGVLLALSYVPFFARYTALKYAQRLEIPLPGHLEPVVMRRLMEAQRGGVIGALLFTVLGTAAFVGEIGVRNDSELTGLFILGGTIAGLGVGLAVAALRSSPQVAPDQPRVARSSAVAPRDFLSPVERVASRVAVVAAVLLLVAAAVLVATGSDIPLWGLAFFAIAGVGALVVFEVAGRRIVDQSQPAGSTAELVWDDAIRASILHDLLTAPLVLGAYGVALGLFVIADGGITQFGFVTALINVAMVAAILVSRTARTQSYFLRRLWPNLRWSDTDRDSSLV